MIREDQNFAESETKTNNLLGSNAVTDLGVKLWAIRREFIAAEANC